MSQNAPVATAAEQSTEQVDPRGQRFAAVLTVALLAVVLATAPSTFALVVLVVQALVFASGALLGPARTPYGWLFRTFVRPRIGAPAETEDARPPRFAQAVGLTFAVVGVVGLGLGLDVLALVAVGFALAAALLNAVFGFCLGCEMYLLGKRIAAPAARAA